MKPVYREVPHTEVRAGGCAELIKRDILVDFHPNAGVRMSPHFYN